MMHPGAWAPDEREWGPPYIPPAVTGPFAPRHGQYPVTTSTNHSGLAGRATDISTSRMVNSITIRVGQKILNATASLRGVFTWWDNWLFMIKAL
jgi:hypothetical protein